MRYLALACDYDGTIATHGTVSDSTFDALCRAQKSGRRLILVTGRQLDDLFCVFPRAEIFDCIVAENGALFYDPRRHREVMLAEPPPEEFINELRRRGVASISVGKSIVATWEPHEAAVLEAIHHCGLELQVIFNKGAIMVLPSGVNKNSGLRAALSWLGLSVHNTIGVGDAENDHAFLTACEFSAAVANALDAVKERVDLVTEADHGAGVEELITDLLDNDLRQHDRHVRRHDILLGNDADGNAVRIPPYDSRLLISGPSGSGKSTIVNAILERLAQAEYQFCVIDPEGDYENMEYAVTVGDEEQIPTTAHVLQLLAKTDSTVVSMLAVPIADRPAYAAQLMQRMENAHRHDGRPHWLLLDEAHHMLPASWQPAPGTSARRFASEALVTVHPRSLDPSALAAINIAIAVGSNAEQTLEELSAAFGRPVRPAPRPSPAKQGLEMLVWFCRESEDAIRVRIEPPEAERRRHRRKYADGDLREKSFYFRGPQDRLKLRAQNLTLFLQIAEGVDADTWLHHLRQGDYSRWIRTAIKDEILADQIQTIEQAGLPAGESLARVQAAVERLYTGSA
ncbi:MAG: HAD family hydrolase [Chromatiales bacterium]|jgi:HAD superfamily hydrolase (TIGR01484 family)|nr:HAD family hydrolase [Chromatiales bacterium]